MKAKILLSVGNNFLYLSMIFDMCLAHKDESLISKPQDVNLIL